MALPESSSPAARSTAKRLDSLTGLRLVLAVMVVFFHYCRRCGLLDGGQWIAKVILEMGAVGVSGFFILSGYILVHVYRDREWSVRGFAVNRFARIYPLYFLALMVAFPLDWWSPGMVDQGKAPAFGLALVLLQSYFPFAVLRFNGPGWSLSVEALFYLLFPVLLKVYLRAKRVFYSNFAVAFILAGLSSAGALQVHFHDFFPLVRVWEFMLGMMLASSAVRNWKPGNEAIALILVLSCPFLAAWAVHMGCAFSGAVAKAMVCGAAISILGKMDTDGRATFFLRRPWMILGGEISYGLYLLHEPVQRYAKILIEKVTASSLLESPFSFKLGFIGVTFLCSILLSYLVWKFIEIPMGRFIRKSWQ